MPDYRLYFLGLDGHFRKAEPIIAANDIDAMKVAREFTDGSELELWEGNRKIVACRLEIIEYANLTCIGLST